LAKSTISVPSTERLPSVVRIRGSVHCQTTTICMPLVVELRIAADTQNSSHHFTSHHGDP
jgi:hypothetical protein